MSSRKLDDLSPQFLPLALQLLGRLVEANIPVMIVNTLRTPAEQAEYIKAGVSWTSNSRHLTGDAIDICPYAVYQEHGPDKLQWDCADPIWAKMAAIGRGLGLRCGYDWQQKDCGHFELPATPPVVRRA